jgi:hypothetical protein
LNFDQLRNFSYSVLNPSCLREGLEI